MLLKLYKFDAEQAEDTKSAESLRTSFWKEYVVKENAELYQYALSKIMSTHK